MRIIPVLISSLFLFSNSTFAFPSDEFGPGARLVTCQEAFSQQNERASVVIDMHPANIHELYRKILVAKMVIRLSNGMEFSKTIIVDSFKTKAGRWPLKFLGQEFELRMRSSEASGALTRAQLSTRIDGEEFSEALQCQYSP